MDELINGIKYYPLKTTHIPLLRAKNSKRPCFAEIGGYNPKTAKGLAFILRKGNGNYGIGEFEIKKEDRKINENQMICRVEGERDFETGVALAGNIIIQAKYNGNTREFEVIAFVVNKIKTHHKKETHAAFVLPYMVLDGVCPKDQNDKGRVVMKKRPTKDHTAKKVYQACMDALKKAMSEELNIYSVPSDWFARKQGWAKNYEKNRKYERV